jgi:small GTP-binding protein
MIQKKICMLGAFAVGKTSLIRSFLSEEPWQDKYHTTMGVKADKKVLSVKNQMVTLMVWDVAGEDEVTKVRTTYFRGASGFLLIADGTRKATLATALELRDRVFGDVGEIPYILLVNKSDLASEWEIDQASLDELAGKGITVMKSSAKLREGVNEAFTLLTERMVC